MVLPSNLYNNNNKNTKQGAEKGKGKKRFVKRSLKKEPKEKSRDVPVFVVRLGGCICAVCVGVLEKWVAVL